MLYVGWGGWMGLLSEVIGLLRAPSVLITKCLDLGREAEFLAAAPSLSPCRSTQWNLKRSNICIIFIIFIRIILSLSLYSSMSLHTVE